MSAIRLRIDQIKKLDKWYASTAEIIEYAIKRYKAGEFKNVIQKEEFSENGTNVLRFTGDTTGFVTDQSMKIVPIREKFEYDSKSIRALLDANFAIKPDVSKIEKAISEIDREIESMIKGHQQQFDTQIELVKSGVIEEIIYTD